MLEGGNNKNRRFSDEFGVLAMNCSVSPMERKSPPVNRKILNESLIYEILSAVGEIPPGRVASYGQIAALIGREQNARLVGRVLSRAELYGEYPCHRVVNHAGRTAPGWREQRRLLEEEGVSFLPNGCVDMKRFRWRP